MGYYPILKTESHLYRTHVYCVVCNYIFVSLFSAFKNISSRIGVVRYCCGIPRIIEKLDEVLKVFAFKIRIK